MNNWNIVEERIMELSDFLREAPGTVVHIHQIRGYL
jgi:hypothetical protein